MAHTFIARMKIFPEKTADFIEACQKMEKAVEENEADALIYRFYKLREPNGFAVIESFRTQAADEAHQQSAHFKEIAPTLIECIDGGWEREYLDPLA